MATTSRTVTTAPVLPSNYAQLYATQPDVINGQYNKLYEPHLPATRQTEDELFETFITSTNTIPKVLLTQVRLVNNTVHIVCLHRPSLYRQDMANPSTKWHNKTIAFVGDIQPGSTFVTTVSFPETTFAITDAQRVPLLADMANQCNNTADDIIGPFDKTIANTEDVHMRMVVPVPHRYVHLVFGKEFTPQQLWE